MANRVTIKTKRVAYPRRAEIRVGILEPGDSHEGGMTVGELAEKHEYGDGNVPARAPIRVFADTRGAEIRRIALNEFRAAKDLAGFERAAARVAVKAGAELRNTITEGLEPDIAESTARRKEARGYPPPHTPLIETGVLRNSYVGDSKVTP
jgi:hypothetical protein